MSEPQDPCGAEPCRGLLTSYWQEFAAAHSRKVELQTLRGRIDFVRDMIRNLTVLWFGLLAVAILCAARLVSLVAACNMLWAAAMLAAVGILVLSVVQWRLTRSMAMAAADCVAQSLVVVGLVADIRAACPEECRVPPFTIDCECD